MGLNLPALPNRQVSLDGALAVQKAPDGHPAPQGTTRTHHKELIEPLPHKQAGRLSRRHLAHTADASHDLGARQI
jgi:hypothetical protein